MRAIDRAELHHPRREPSVIDDTAEKHRPTNFPTDDRARSDHDGAVFPGDRQAHRRKPAYFLDIGDLHEVLDLKWFTRIAKPRDRRAHDARNAEGARFG